MVIRSVRAGGRWHIVSDETVKVRISILIDSEGEYDTGYSVDQWNALTDAQKSQMIEGFWDEEAQNDNGGVMLLTKGAVL